MATTQKALHNNQAGGHAVFNPKAAYHQADLSVLCAKKIEGQFFERKSKRAPDKLAETICAFANSNPQVGGLLAVGISDDGEIDGLKNRPDLNLNALQRYHYSTGTPTQHRMVNCKNKNGQDDQILLIYIPYLENRVAETSKGKAYVREGDNTRELRDEEKRELEYTKGQISFEDELACEFTREAIADDILEEYRKSVVATDRVALDVPIEQILQSRWLLKRKDDKPYLTKAALLLLGKDPTALVAGAYVRFLRYAGTEKKSGAAHNVVKEEIFRGPLPRVFMQVTDFIKSQLREFTYLGTDGKFVQEPEYPEPAWQEAIVNALVHRSYSLTNMPILVEMFDDRIQVESPGDYPTGVHPREFIHNPRNPRLMEGMRYLRFVRMLSEGSLRMRQEMDRANLPSPNFSQPGHPYVRLILRNDIERRMRGRTGEGQAVDEFTNLFRLTWKPVAQDGGEAKDAPGPGQIKHALVQSLRANGYAVDSFTQDRSVNPNKPHDIPDLRSSGLAAVYTGFKFRVVSLSSGLYLLLDHDVQVRNRATLDKVLSVAPQLRGRDFGKAFVRVNEQWVPCRIREIRDETTAVSVRTESGEDQVIDAKHAQVMPMLPTTWIAEILAAAGVRFDLHKTVKMLALTLTQNAPRERAKKTAEIAADLSRSIFPLSVGDYRVDLDSAPEQLKGAGFDLKSDLNDALPVFSKQVEQKASTIISGLSTYGSYEKPERSVPLVLLCTQDTVGKMNELVDQLKRGAYKFRGMEKTFALSFGNVTVADANSPEDYLAKCRQVCGSVPRDAFFLVYCPERGYSRADYSAPYYKVKHFLLEAGFPSQMVDEETIGNPSWKDFNLALDVFAKAGHVPWVLSEGLPCADLFLGLSYSSIRTPGQSARLLSYVNVFDRYGKWLYYKGNTKAIKFEERNQMFWQLLKDVANDYQNNAKLHRMHVHHDFPLSHADRKEIAAGVRAAAPNAEVSFVHVNTHSNFRLYDSGADGDGSLGRGNYVVLAPNRFLISTTGQNDFGQKGMGTPRALEVTVNRVGSKDELDLRVYAQHMLSLTRLNWASTKDFCREPITLKFADDIAYLMNVFLTSFGGFTLHQRLERTPWFL